MMEIDDDEDILEVFDFLEVLSNNGLIETERLDRWMAKTDSDIHNRMVTHVVWPRYLPSKQRIDTNQHEVGIIALMTDTLKWFKNTEMMPNITFRMFQAMFNIRTSSSAQIITSEINRLQPGEMLGIFVKEQHCGLSIFVNSIQDSSTPLTAIVSSFPVQIPNKEIYVAKDSDIQVDFPNRSVRVKFSTMINSPEFSKQLWYLNRIQIKHGTSINEEDNVCTSLVSQWLLPMLTNFESAVVAHHDFPVISKKIRDDVVGTKNASMQPFRRSSYWTFLKVMLQLNLTVELGETNGKLVYKLVMLKFMTVLCSYYNTHMYSSLKVDLVSLMLAKLARRIEKVNSLISMIDEQSPDELENLPNGFNQLFNSLTDEVKSVISNVRNKLDLQITTIQTDDESLSRLLPLSGIDFNADVFQQVPSLRDYLDKRQIRPQSTQTNGDLNVPFYSRHHLKSNEAPDIRIFAKLKSKVQTGIFLCDVENWILYTLNDDNPFEPDILRSLSFAYTRTAERYYKGDQLGFSRIVLTQMKLLSILDKIATQNYKLLKQHRAGVYAGIFDNLILPQNEDFQIAHELKKYFVKRSQKSVVYPSLLEEENVSEDSFSARFAEKSQEMQHVKRTIKEYSDNKMAFVLQEWEDRRQEVGKLRKKMETLECEYTVNANGKRQHKNKCPRCKVEAKIRNIRVNIFEQPLPDSEYEQNAVIFELQIPNEISCLRDVLYEVVRLLNGPAKKTRIYGKWIESEELEDYNNSDTERVFLGSTIRSTVQGRSRNKGVHPDAPFESCTLKNPSTCTYYGISDGTAYHISNSIEGQSIKQLGTFLVEQGSPYENLQWTLNGTSHTQNQVLARQFECPQSLTLSEFKNFGSLRADGHRLQLRKLYAMIETESLSFENLSVQSLILQTLWEVGPSLALGNQWNESHEDFTDPKFALLMIELIDKFINKQKCNWKHPLKLIIAALIAVRVFEMNEDANVADRIVQLLAKLRDIAFDWTTKVQTAMQETETQVDVEKLRLNLVEIAIGGALTFFVHFRHEYFDKIFRSMMNSITAVRFWLQFVVSINANILLRSNDTIKTSVKANQELFQRIVHRIGVQIESKVKEMIVNDPNDVFDFIKSQWPQSNDAIFNLKLDNKHPETIIISAKQNSEEHFVQIGIINGSFLVNNLPVSRLPKVITEDPVFERFFEQFVFDVYQVSSDRFCTKFKYRNRDYNFFSSKDGVIISEKRQNNDEYELIPENILVGEIPFLLVENHSHWWSKTRNVIEFRPTKFSDPNISLHEEVQYTLDLNEGRLENSKTKKIMLDVTSKSYEKIVSQLSRLESRKFIQVVMEEPQIAKVELVRMNIKFIVDTSSQEESYDVISNEFNGMRVSLEQKCGTLYGLRQGLLLESATDKSKLMILPHGNITARPLHNHEIVEIDTESTLRSPPFFTYQIDDICKQLKATNRSYATWFYLAYLHALTSHGLPEPFTEMSGTERSMQILESGFAFSSAPYDDEALVTLKLIGKLAPCRKIKNNMQSVRWPDMIQSHAAHDLFLFITSKLLTDSKRLEELHPKQSTGKKDETEHNQKLLTEMAVNKREYFRCLPFFPNLQVAKKFVKHRIGISTHYIHDENDTNLESLRLISNLYHQSTYRPPRVFSLSDYLTKSDDDLNGSRDIDDEKELLEQFSMKDVRDVWMSLYNVARTGQFSREKFTLALGLLAHNSQLLEDFNAILLLQTVSMNQAIFNSIEAPQVRVFYPNDKSFDFDTIVRILEGYKTEKVYGGRYSQRMKEIDDAIAIGEYIYKIASKIRDMWPCDEVDLNILRYTHPNVNLRDAVKVINKKFRDWRNNQELREFLRKIDEQIRRLNSTVLESVVLIPWCYEKFLFKNIQKFYVDFDAKIAENLPLYDVEIIESEEIFNQDESMVKRSAQDWWNLYKKIASPNDAQHLIDAGMYPRLVLSVMLPKLLSPTHDPKLKAVLCAVAVRIVHEQRKRRITIYSQAPELKAALDQEQENEPHANWSPIQYPEWLLFEIEQDLTIRPIQIEIAKRMIDPPEIGTKHSVMQLNMGEGKTAVIVPILAAILANGQQLCQVTVLKSLFATNLKGLRQCLGGMLNRRVYVFPCRRDMPINKYVESIMEIYKECKRLKGVVLTLPEYRLSFQLKMYEAPRKDDMECGKLLLTTHQWLNLNVRNILDESDAILHPKYQLIYTLGQQLSLDGGALRWTVIQALFKRLPFHLKQLNHHYGDEKIVFDKNYVKSGRVYGPPSMNFRSDVFTPCKIFDNHVYDVLKGKLIDDFIANRLNSISAGINPGVKETLKLLLSNRDVPANTFNELFDKLTSSQHTTIMILSGLLRFDVLKLVLSKRWRVNYGVNENGPRQMAIPFKAKDVAAEMTEFGHPDVAICLTHLSYYYSGLNESQLYQVFNTLESCQNSSEIYEKWIRSIPIQLIDESIQSYSGVNLSDPKQRKEIVFPLFRHNMYVIDYWLSNLVFHKEAKTFEHKLMCSSWDLVSDQLKLTVSGFSGTNDTKNILPMPITQNDLPELEQTNDNVRNILLREENSAYYRLPANVRGMEILIKLSKLKIPVLLDSGACMLELNNEQVAQKWLNLVDPELFDATVYFNENDLMMTVDRNGVTIEFDYSVHRNKLNRCLVYLDDAHTRGTDLKFPQDWRACVTLSGDITRDKTVQACMRMRLLGKGHSILWMASYEADVRIREFCNLDHTKPTNKNVIEFICNNSSRFEYEHSVHWSANAYNYTKKLVAHKLSNRCANEDDALRMLHVKCIDNEYVTLREMYGLKEEVLLTQICSKQFTKIGEAYVNDNEIVQMIKSIQDNVNRKLSMLVPELQKFTQSFDEEQEKELEHELEEERQVERPPPALPATPIYDKLLELVVASGVTSQAFRTLINNKGLISFHESLAGKPFYDKYESDGSAWSRNLYVSKDFNTVVEDQFASEFLRPTWWVAQITHRAGNDVFVLLSSFEANLLLPHFRKSNRSALLSYRPKLSPSHSNLLRSIELKITAMTDNCYEEMDLDAEVQISTYAGSMYFSNDDEQNAYCSFLGLIPNPRSKILEAAYERGIISSNCFVPPENRQHSAAISKRVNKCKFIKNPVDLAISLIEINHQSIRKESHVSFILEKGMKFNFDFR